MSQDSYIRPWIEQNRKDREARKQKKAENRAIRQDKRADRKADRKAGRKAKREQRQENMKQTFTAMFQKAEDVIDTVWQGETDQAKVEREAYNEQVYKEQDAQQQKIFEYAIYIGLGGACLIAIYMFFK